MGLSFHSLFSDKNISEGLYLEKPLDERKVRDAECLVYTASQPFGAGLFVFREVCGWRSRKWLILNELYTGHLQTLSKNQGLREDVL